MYGLEPSDFRSSIMCDNKVTAVPIRTHDSFSQFQALAKSDGTWDVCTAYGGKALITLDKENQRFIIRQALVDSGVSGSRSLIDTMFELTKGIVFGSESNKYPYAKCTANGLPMFEGMMFDTSGNCLNTRDTIMLRRSRKHSVKKLANNVADTIRAAIALLPNDRQREYYPGISIAPLPKDRQREYYPGISIERVKGLLAHEFIEKYDGTPLAVAMPAQYAPLEYNISNWNLKLNEVAQLFNITGFADPCIEAFAGYLTGYWYADVKKVT